MLQEREDFVHLEYACESASEGRTISQFAKSQYSTMGGPEINHVTLISAILGGDANVEGVKLCQSLPSVGERATASTILRDDPLQNITASAVVPDERSIMEGDKSTSINIEHLTMPSCKPALARGCRNKGGERDVDAEVDNSGTSSTSVASDNDTVNESTSSTHCDVHDDCSDLSTRCTGGRLAGYSPS